MAQEQHKSCYGKRFPSILSVDIGDNRGTALSIHLGKPHGMFTTERRVQVDMEQWDDRLACEEFDHCRTLSQAKLALESAVSQ